MTLLSSGPGMSNPPRSGPNTMTIAQHLEELRRRIVVAVASFVVAGGVSAVFYERLLNFLQRPYCEINPHDCKFYVTGPLDPLSLRIKLAAFGGLLLASPVVLWEVWRFIGPGLRRTERRYAVPFIAASIAFFLLGCGIVYVVLPHTLGWLVSVGGPSVHELLNPNAYLTLVLLLMLLFGLTFEFPVALVALQLAGAVSPGALLRSWRWAVLGVTVSAAILTPSSDPFSMLALAVPLIGFYFVAIGIGTLLRGHSASREPAE